MINEIKRKMYKRIVVMILVVLMLPNFCFASDQPAGWADDSVSELEALGHFRDYLFSDYDHAITRGEFIYVVVRMYEVLSGVEVKEDPNISFTDTDDLYVLKEATLGITNGEGNGRFGYEDSLTREQLAVFMIKLLSILDMDLIQSPEEIFADDPNMSPWAREAIYLARNNKILTGVGNNEFNPSGTASKEMVLVVANNILKARDGLSCTNQKGHIVNVDIKNTVKGYYQDGSNILKTDTSDKKPNIEGNQAARSLEDFGQDSYFFGTVENLFNYAGYTLAEARKNDYYTFVDKNLDEDHSITYVGRLFVDDGSPYYDVEDSFNMSIHFQPNGDLQAISFFRGKGRDNKISLTEQYKTLLRYTGIENLGKDFAKLWVNYYEGESLLDRGTLKTLDDFNIEYFFSDYGYSCSFDYGGKSMISSIPDDFEAILSNTDINYKIGEYDLDFLGGVKNVVKSKFGIEDVYKSNNVIYVQRIATTMGERGSYDYTQIDVDSTPTEHTYASSIIRISLPQVEGRDGAHVFRLNYLVDANSLSDQILSTIEVRYLRS